MRDGFRSAHDPPKGERVRRSIIRFFNGLERNFKQTMTFASQTNPDWPIMLSWDVPLVTACHLIAINLYGG